MTSETPDIRLSRRTALSLGVGAAAATVIGPGRTASAAGTKIGFAEESFQVPRWKYLDLPYFKRVVDGAGMELVDVQADFDVGRQLGQVEQLITVGCKVIAVAALVGKAGVAMVRACKTAGVPAVAYNDMIPSADVAAYVSRDNYLVGKMAIDAAKNAGVLKGNWVIVSGEAGQSVADDQTAAYTAGLAPLIKDGTVKVVSHEWHMGWNAEDARAQVENALTANKDNIQGILCNNDQMAIGCLVALEKANVAGKVFLNGLDATTEACRAILQDRMTLSAFTPCDEMGRAGGEICVKLAKGEPLGLLKTYDVGNGIKQPWYPIASYNVTKANMVGYLKRYSPAYVNASAVFKGIPESQWPAGAEELFK
jgi:D-xylose transport system substrate-binding protein